MTDREFSTNIVDAIIREMREYDGIEITAEQREQMIEASLKTLRTKWSARKLRRTLEMTRE